MNRDNRRTVVARTTVAGTSGSYNWEVFARAVHGETFANATTPGQVAAGIRIIQAMSNSATPLI
jgi:hypothetical protein